MSHRTRIILALYIASFLLWIYIFATEAINSSVRRWFGRYYSVDRTIDVNMLVIITYQASIAIEMLEQYYNERGYYPETVSVLNTEKYPKYIHDTFKSEYASHIFPLFKYERHGGDDFLAINEYYTLSSQFGKDWLVYNSRFDDWRYYQRGRSPSGYLIAPAVLTENRRR